MLVRVPVVADADTLFGGTTRSLLIQLNTSGDIHLHWSALILDEMSRALVATQRQPSIGAAEVNVRRMMTAAPHAVVAAGDVLSCMSMVSSAVRSTKDMHVAACAAAALGKYPQGRVVHLATKNVRDFNLQALALLRIDVQTPDEFLAQLCSRNPRRLAAAFGEVRRTLRSRPDVDTLLGKLAADGQVQTALMLGASAQAGELDL